MTDQQPQRDPDQWKTGDEPMTEAQSSYLHTLSEEAGEPFDESLTKAQASERIDELQARSPRLNEGAPTQERHGSTEGADGPADTPPHPSPAEGGGTAAPRAPHPSQAEGERDQS